MPYQANIPQPTDALRDSQADMLGNFQAINTFVAVNHVPFNDPSGDEGKHKFITFPVQVSDPVYSLGECGLFNKNYTNTSVNELHITNAAGTVTPFTASDYINAGDNGWTYLPSGLLMTWGTRILTISGSSVSVVYNDATQGGINSFPGFGTFAAQPVVSRMNNAATTANFVVLATSSTTGFSAYASGPFTGTVQFSWFVIGK